jgi:hypothetical protein
MSVIGRIHSFESCGTVDGPGIRFITFFQGCLMRCLYCHNRDTWDTHGGKEITVEELMKEVVTYRHFMNASGGGVTLWVMCLMTSSSSPASSCSLSITLIGPPAWAPIPCLIIGNRICSSFIMWLESS